MPSMIIGVSQLRVLAMRKLKSSLSDWHLEHMAQIEREGFLRAIVPETFFSPRSTAADLRNCRRVNLEKMDKSCTARESYARSDVHLPITNQVLRRKLPALHLWQM